MYSKRKNTGLFKPINPKKYIGNPTRIVYRSLWELKAMRFFDQNSSILEWKSEEIVIPYLSPVDNRMHRYFPDFWVKLKDKNGEVKQLLLEIKPASQLSEPKKKKRITKRFITEAATYAVNQAKFKAAKQFSIQRGWDFRVLTEYDLGIKK